MVMYVNLTDLINLGSAFMGMAAAQAGAQPGGEPGAQALSQLPPIAIGVSIKDSAVTERVYIPVKTIAAVRDLADGVMGMMGGGGSATAGRQEGPAPAPR